MYTTGILRNRGHIPIAVNFMRDHVHLLFGLNPNESLATLMRELKVSLTQYINQKKWTNVKFEWQVGYSAFGCSRKDLEIVETYVNNQEAHHKRKTFKDEYLQFLIEQQIQYKPEYLYEWVLDDDHTESLNGNQSG